MFPQQMFPVRANGETFRETTVFRQQCFLVLRGLKLFSPVLTTAFELHSESPFQCKNYFSTAFDKACT